MSLAQLAQTSQIVGAIVFVIVTLLIWNKFLAPAVKAYQEAKNAELAEGEARRERMRADVTTARNEIERADAEARTIAQRAAAAATHDRERALAEARAEAERVVRNAEGELERARMAARDRLRIEFIEKALTNARSEAPSRVSDAVNTVLVTQTVDGLARGKA